MKFIFSLLTLFFCFQSVADELTQVKEDVSRYGHKNEAVLTMAETFLQELETIYERGEGLIESDLHKIYSAVSFAAKKHQFQTRKGPEKLPYIIHPIGVAHHLIHIGHVRDPDMIMGALLHDTVEDTDATFEEIKELFGSRVEGFVRELTDDKSLPKEERKRLQIVNAPHKSAGAAQIKLCDKLYNLTDLLKNPPSDWSQERIDQYFAWAGQVVNALPWVNGFLKKEVDNVIDLYYGL